MILKRFFVSTATAIATLGLIAAPVFAAVGNQNPQLTVELTINPTVVSPPNQVTGIGKVTNNTNKTQKVVIELEVTSPSGLTSPYYENKVIGKGETFSQTIIYTVPADAEKGIYTVTLSATNKAGTSWATEYLTVE